MKFNKTFQTIVSLIIVVTLIIPLSATKKTEAQTVGFGAVNYGNTEGTSLSGIIGNLSPLIKKLPGCTSTLGTGNLFSGIKKVVSGKSSKIDKYTSVDGLADLATQAVAIIEGVPTYDANLQQMVGDIKAQQKTQGETLNRVDKSTSSDNKNNTCLNSIGKAVIKTIVDKMTVSIVNWINTGNSGDSFFVKNPSQYFKDIAKNQILSFGEELKDSAKYPFAKNFMLNAANSFNNTFQQNAQYSLNKTLNGQQESFFNDFSQGGWGAWDALTQNPANNPLGFAIMASNELQARIANKTTEKTQELTQSGGFLNQEKCVDPEGVTKEEDESARNAGGRYLDAQGTNVAGGRYIDEQGTNTQARICKKWETVTPGQTIASKLTKSMNNSEDALLSADTLNDAIGAILDAALAKLSATLTDPEKGLAGISESDISASYNISGYEDDGLADYQTSQTETDFSSYQRDSSPWLQSHPEFDIRTDLNQALIDEQRIYIDKLKNLNYILMHPDNSTYSKYNGLIPTIYQLDYCIPGPNPNWENDAQSAINKWNLQAENIENTARGYEDSSWYAVFDALTLGIGPSVAGIFNSANFGCGGDTGDAAAARALANIISYITGLDGANHLMNTPWYGIMNIKDLQTRFCSANGFSLMLDKIFSAYVPILKKHYNTNTLPSTAQEAANKFNKIEGYKQMIIDNEKAIANQEGVIKQIQAIKSSIEGLDRNSVTYEDDLIPWKNSFARLSPSLVSGGDIAYVDDLAKQAEDERLYVLNDLLQGPAGCEKELLNESVNLLSWGTSSIGSDYYTVRPRPYPHELLYMISPKTGLNYYNTLNNTPQTYQTTPNVRYYAEGFLTFTPFYSGCNSPTGNNWEAFGSPPGSAKNQYSDVIYVETKDSIGNCMDEKIFNTIGGYVGGNAYRIEEALNIY